MCCVREYLPVCLCCDRDGKDERGSEWCVCCENVGVCVL